MDIATVLISGAVGAVTSAITAYFTSKMKVSEEREKWSRELTQKYAEALATSPGVAANMARQYGIAVLVMRSRVTTDARSEGKYFIMPNSRHVVGRAPDCDINLDDPAISHHQVAFSADSSDVYVETMGARNPILINGKEIEGRVRLGSGDHVTVGKMRFEVLLLS